MSETLVLDTLGDWRRSHDCGGLRGTDVGSVVCLMGWAQFRRDHGGLIFIDLRDRGGLTRSCSVPKAAKRPWSAPTSCAPNTWWPSRAGVRARPDGMANPNMPTGEVEVEVSEFKLLNTALTPPFPIEDRIDASEMLRLKYRYLDLRRPSWPPISSCATRPSRASGVISTPSASWRSRPRC